MQRSGGIGPARPTRCCADARTRTSTASTASAARRRPALHPALYPLPQAKETHGSKKFHKFFLVDSAGNRHLAATGEDTGDAHYNYSSSKPFNKYGTINCHNRREVLLW